MPAKAARRDDNLFNESLNPETVVRIKRHERDYLMVANKTVQDERLSWETLGLLVYLLSLPADWEIRVRHLQTRGGKWDEGKGENHGTGRDSVRRMLRELQSFGYLSGVGRESQERAQRGRFGQNEIVVYESPSLNPFYAEQSPSPENQSTAAGPSADSPSPDSPSPENQATYKEQNPQKTQRTNHTHQQTGLRAVGAPAVVVGEGSKFSLEDCRRYADNLHASGQGVNNPGGFARKIHQTGAEDPQIAAWLAKVDPERVRSGELAPPALVDVSACPDCEGRGMRYVDSQNYSKGVVRCKHPRLVSAA